LGDPNDPELTRHPLHILGDILVFIWEVVWLIINIWVGILQILMGF